MRFVKEILLSSVCHAGTYLKSSGKGKTVDIQPWAISEGSDEIITSEKIPINKFPFVGIDSSVMWFSYSGAISFDNTNGISAATGIENNLVIAPLWSKSNIPPSGQIVWKVVDNKIALSRLDTHINGHYAYEDFKADRAFSVDYKNVANPMDTSEKNNYQMFYVIDANGDAATIYNYYNMAWMPEDVEIGIFAGRKESEQCHSGFVIPTDVNSLSSDSNCGHSGSWVIAVPKSGIECNQQFETECPEPTQGDRATWTGIMKTDSSSDSTQWVFEAHHHCLPKHSISRNHRTSIIQCLYDADYYDSRWSIEPPSCQDLSTLKTYDVELLHDPMMTFGAGEAEEIRYNLDTAVIDLNGKPVKTPVSNVILNSLQDFTDNLGVENQLMSDIISNRDADLDNADFGDEFGGNVMHNNLMHQPFSINFELGMPASLKDKVSADMVQNSISQMIEVVRDDSIRQTSGQFSTVIVKETTSKCLVECLGCKNKGKCSGTPPPIPYDACCGRCEILNGKVMSTAKPYSTLIAACCPSELNGRFVYDPLSFVCCPVTTNMTAEAENVLIPLSEYVKYGSNQNQNCKNAIDANPMLLNQD